MNILYQEITSRLQKILDLPRTTIPDLFKAWEVEAYKLKGELLDQGLEESAKEVQRIIDEQLQFKPKESL